MLTIHVVSKCHLDVGFTDFARAVRERYLDDFIPRAIATARQLREEGGAERLVWTVGAWIVMEALDAWRGRRLASLERAIQDGDIAWHALPFTTQTEQMDAVLFRYGLSLSRRMDERFGKRTIAAKMTDVPGHTRAMVPLLAEAGVRFLHLGINPASTPPDVPDCFVWRVGGSEVVVLYDKGDYGRTTLLPGMRSAMAFAHAGDNLGPPDADRVRSLWDGLRAAYPGARLSASRLDDYAEAVLRIRKSLPVVTAEMGDTWVHGGGTDPAKMAAFRALLRLRAGWPEPPAGSAAARRLDRFHRFLLVVPEHTWSLDEKKYLDDYTAYTAAALARLRRTGKCRRFEASWREQRDYITSAVEALGRGSLRREAEGALAALAPRRPDTGGFGRVRDTGRVFDAGRFAIAFDPATGAIAHLRDRRTGRVWADGRHLLGLFGYELFTAGDYARFGRQYLRNWPQSPDWAIKDFTKPGIEGVAYEHTFATPVLRSLWHRVEPDGVARFVVRMGMAREVTERFGAPAEVVMEVCVAADGAAAGAAYEGGIGIDLQWFRKRACRLPEASWFSFRPKLAGDATCTLGKMGERVSPLDVAPNGGRKLHAVTDVAYVCGGGKIAIETLDAALVAPGERSLLNHNRRQPPVRKGVHFNLHNNIWGTNFPMWYEEDARFRFVLTFEGGA